MYSVIHRIVVFNERNDDDKCSYYMKNVMELTVRLNCVAYLAVFVYCTHAHRMGINSTCKVPKVALFGTMTYSNWILIAGHTCA